jgi:hypothetical protein
MDNEAGIAAQRMMNAPSGTQLHDDGLSALRGLLDAQRKALAGDDGDGFDALTAKF